DPAHGRGQPVRDPRLYGAGGLLARPGRAGQRPVQPGRHLRRASAEPPALPDEELAPAYARPLAAPAGPDAAPTAGATSHPQGAGEGAGGALPQLPGFRPGSGAGSAPLTGWEPLAGTSRGSGPGLFRRVVVWRTVRTQSQRTRGDRGLRPRLQK